jgi:maltose O-acetyltransferase
MLLSYRRYLANLLAGILPPTRCFALKAAIWRAAGVEVAAGARLVSSVRIWTSGPVSIGADTFLGHEVMIVGGDAPVRIGAQCDIAPRVMLATGSHRQGDPDRAAGPGFSLPITVGCGTWIGAATTILGGVEIGERTIVGAGSLVNRSIADDVIAYGAPCAEVRSRRDHRSTGAEPS